MDSRDCAWGKAATGVSSNAVKAEPCDDTERRWSVCSSGSSTPAARKSPPFADWGNIKALSNNGNLHRLLAMVKC